MGGEIRSLQITISLRDYDRWPAEARAEAAAAYEARGEYDDEWPAQQLIDVMILAGQEFMDRWPGVLAVPMAEDDTRERAARVARRGIGR
jgi:hypothetical protein